MNKTHLVFGGCAAGSDDETVGGPSPGETYRAAQVSGPRRHARPSTGPDRKVPIARSLGNGSTESTSRPTDDGAGTLAPTGRRWP